MNILIDNAEIIVSDDEKVIKIFSFGTLTDQDYEQISTVKAKELYVFEEYGVRIEKLKLPKDLEKLHLNIYVYSLSNIVNFLTNLPDTLKYLHVNMGKNKEDGIFLNAWGTKSFPKRLTLIYRTVTCSENMSKLKKSQYMVDIFGKYNGIFTSKIYTSDEKYTIKYTGHNLLDLVLVDQQKTIVLVNSNMSDTVQNDIIAMEISESFSFLMAQYDYGRSILSRIYKNLKTLKIKSINIISNIELWEELRNCKNLTYLEIDEKLVPKNKHPLNIRTLKLTNSSCPPIFSGDFPNLRCLNLEISETVVYNFDFLNNISYIKSLTLNFFKDIPEFINITNIKFLIIYQENFPKMKEYLLYQVNKFKCSHVNYEFLISERLLLDSIEMNENLKIAKYKILDCFDRDFVVQHMLNTNRKLQLKFENDETNTHSPNIYNMDLYDF